ncbi:Dolichyl-phosphate-mannose--protein mannosyltransferase 4 [Wickerhamiella sorbophila]|uniref:Dolichyl-phosphate-mannose--protein mannosyltransferase n=1 Tax=Wickerhamiella sorbophila TaxID=45607 RepID=A0A2T0FPB8_9ASCO|nr:Dolichyl-phosphate-mannose--protein mannosyltransferase 4 [Wickerhamiella sorbophila]PRT56827.1 Dolichyl-phosphate-mannose--protein mannosyltransferase 4 [Wickerhamiella sorbophila]
MVVKERRTRKKTDEVVAVGKTPAPVVHQSAKQVASSSNYVFLIAKLIVTAISFVTRFHKLEFPNEVVFDEVHFGKFASHYLERKYFFDLHPPFAKLLLAFVGWMNNYNGAFKFENIGMVYPEDVPYVAYRLVSAWQGALVVPLVFSIMEQTGFSVAACTLSSLVVALDNAQILHSRLILLDSTLVFTFILSLYFYIRFLKSWRKPFTWGWTIWLALTGLSLSLVMSTKYVGLFAFLSVGSSVVCDLWRIADIRNGNSMRTVFRHFRTRAFYLILLPFFYFLIWFYIHFKVLTFSGPGDSFMSRRFQSTLAENPLTQQALEVHFYDRITIKSTANPSVFLHSHPDHYPRQYPDNRISSAGQQVTGYTHDDINNIWQLLPENDIPEAHRGRMPFVGRQAVRLYHPSTDSYLLTHDVASPNYSAYQEVTTVTGDEAVQRYNETLWDLEFVENPTGQAYTKVTTFRIRHPNTNAYLRQSDKTLPDWGFNQVDIHAPRNTDFGSSQIWTFDDIIDLEDRESRIPERDEESAGFGSMPFLFKYAELQDHMFRSNNNLVQDHPYNSWPKSWPLLRRGVSYWTKDQTKSQIYLMGNYFGWYLELVALMTFIVSVVADQLLQLRGIELFSVRARRKLYKTVSWFFGAWAFHYLPFFTMHRQLFLHHYLPAHVIASFVVGGMADIIFLQQETSESPRTVNKYMKVFTALTSIGMLLTFFWVAPLTYGWPLTPEQVRARQIGAVALHFNR